MYKNIEDRKACSRRHYLQNKKQYLDKNVRRKTEAKVWIQNYKSKLKCSSCSETDSRCLDFHHLSNKITEVSTMINSGYSLKTIETEITKCIILCSNCHRKLHSGIV